MKKALFIIISLVGLNGLVQAQQITAKASVWIEMYELDEDFAINFITGFMGGYQMGFASATSSWDQIDEDYEFEVIMRKFSLATICQHREVDAKQGAAMVYKYLKDHPEIWDKHINLGALEAFRFYCPIKISEQ